MTGISSDAIFSAIVIIMIAIIGFLIKSAVDYGIMKSSIQAAHKRLDKLNGTHSSNDKE